MLRFKCFILLFMSWLNMNDCNSQESFESAVQEAVRNQLEFYPNSTLQDVYKNFFQDRYGPGHLISDTAAAGKYLRKELNSFETGSTAYYEPTGWEGNFYRVNLSVIKEGLVPYNDFFDAFVPSVNGIQPIPIQKWEQEWNSIDSIIQAMNLNLIDYERDRQAIFDLLKQGKYVMHHSPLFEKYYSPHYRIIEKSIFEKEIRNYFRKE